MACFLDTLYTPESTVSQPEEMDQWQPERRAEWVVTLQHPPDSLWAQTVGNVYVCDSGV